MASNYYGINAGKNADSAVVANATSATDVEIRYDTTNVTSREQLLLAIDNLKNFILQQPFAPL